MRICLLAMFFISGALGQQPAASPVVATTPAVPSLEPDSPTDPAESPTEPAAPAPFDEESHGEHPTKPLEQSSLILPPLYEPLNSWIEARLMPNNLGDGLFPPEIWPTLPEAARPSHLASEPPTAPLAEELQGRYFTSKPLGILLDPQGLLDEWQKEELESFLRESSQQQGVVLRLMVFDQGQKLLNESLAREAIERWYKDEKAVLGLYFLGEPQRATVYFSALLQKRYAQDLAERWQSQGRREAAIPADELNQFTRFALLLGTRTRGLAREPLRIQSQPASPSGSRGKVLAWVAAFSGAAAVCLWWWLRRPQQRPSPEQPPQGPWLLPEHDYPVRLQAPHAGGHHAYLKFYTK